MRDVVTGLARRLGLGDAPRPGLIGEWPGPGETPALTGIVALPLRVGPAPDGRGLSAALSITRADTGEMLLRETLTLTAEWQTVDLKVHSHLLPNGTVRLRAGLKAGRGVRGWTGEIGLRLANSGKLAEAVRDSLRRFGTPALFIGPCDSAFYDYRDEGLVPWFDRADAAARIARLRAEGRLSETEAAWLGDFVRDGFVVMDGLLDPALIEQIGGELDDAVAQKWQGYSFGSSQRLEGLHRTYPGVRALWAHPGIRRILELLFEERARPCQTLTYVFGSQQDAHQDTIHLTPFPAGYMCGVWVAIDDVQPDSGELVVYRGSHRRERLRLREVGCAKVTDRDWTEFGRTVVPRWRAMIDSGNFEAIVYRPKRGTVLIWHENLLHAGSQRRDPTLSRRSIVSHVFADGALAYYDSTGLAGHMEPLETLPDA